MGWFLAAGDRYWGGSAAANGRRFPAFRQFWVPRWEPWEAETWKAGEESTIWRRLRDLIMCNGPATLASDYYGLWLTELVICVFRVIVTGDFAKA